MFGIEPSELLLVALVALVVIGPKDLPKAMRVVGFWIGKARGVARQFQSGFDEIIRESELAEMEKRWAEENERIMRDHPHPVGNQLAIEHEATVPSDPAAPVMTPLPPPAESVLPVHVEKPVVAPASVDEPPRPPHDGVAS